ncbi:hypothetical protein CMUS01_01341 [Colletotrichum musicola]|uniref:Uncharacterized protein n=1 Tax=Colletotrichum musicola TaxID=2175873 RepID=A0A8H6U8M2_9PEZI|nr:hypothetical protein CMUS01_01341 [Colletotrichum musicola]
MDGMMSIPAGTRASRFARLLMGVRGRFRAAQINLTSDNHALSKWLTDFFYRGQGYSRIQLDEIRRAVMRRAERKIGGTKHTDDNVDVCAPQGLPVWAQQIAAEGYIASRMAAQPNGSSPNTTVNIGYTLHEPWMAVVNKRGISRSPFPL